MKPEIIKPEPETKACINCGHEIGDKFCSNCGQRVLVKRITLKESWLDFWSRVYGFDGMFPRTLRDLTLQPGSVARKFIDGNRVTYYGPVGYFFLMVTLFIVVAGMLDVDLREFINQKQNTLGNFTATGDNQEKINDMVKNFVSEHLRFIAFLVIPFNALMARFILFRKSGLNYIEHAVLPLYMIGHLYWLSIISIIVFAITGSFVLNTVNSFVLILGFGFAYTNFISYQSKVKSFFKGIGVYIGGQFMLIIFITVIAIIVIVLLNYINPDSLEMIRPSNNK